MQVKEIEKRDSTLTSSQQLDRLTRPGATYFNLNPYDVSIDQSIFFYFAPLQNIPSGRGLVARVLDSGLKGS